MYKRHADVVGKENFALIERCTRQERALDRRSRNVELLGRALVLIARDDLQGR